MNPVALEGSPVQGLNVPTVARAAKAASRLLATVPGERRVAALMAAADAIEEHKQVAASHGAVRWQQGYKLVEVMREWRHLHLCLVDELELDCAERFDVVIPSGDRYAA